MSTKLKDLFMKRKIFAGVLCVILLLSACGMENENVTVQVEKLEPTTVPVEMQENETPKEVPLETEKAESVKAQEDTPLADAGSEEQLPAEDGSSDSYRKIYGQIVSEKEGDGLLFSLIYLDDDDIPELVVCDRGYDAYSVYTIKDGGAFCLMDSMTTVEMVYFERRGVVSQFARWNGGGEEGGYGWYYYQVSGDKTFMNGDLPTLHYSYDAVYDEQGNWTGEGVTKYYQLDQEIDETAYQQLMKDLEIVEGNGRSCTASAFGKKEMMELLGK